MADQEQGTLMKMSQGKIFFGSMEETAVDS